MALSANTVWEVRTSGADTNGGGFVSDSGGTDYSQQDSPQLAVTDAACTGNTTLTSATGGFTAAMIGSVVYLSSGPGWYQITARASTNSVTIDRNGPNASGMTANVGGALASPQVAFTLMTAVGMKTWVKAGTYSVGTGLTFPSSGGSGFQGVSVVEGYTTTRGDRSTKPVVRAAAAITLVTTTANDGTWLVNLDLDGNSTGTNGVSLVSSSYGGVAECLVRRFTGYGIQSATSNAAVVRNEVTACGTTAGINVTGAGVVVAYNYVHDNTVTGVVLAPNAASPAPCFGNVVANNTGAGSDGISCSGYVNTIVGNTAYGNGRDGLRLTLNYLGAQGVVARNLLVSNGGYGVNMTSAPLNQAAPPAVLANAFYGNTSGPRNNYPAGASDVTLTAAPFVNAAGGDFSLNTTAGGGAACRAAGIPGALPGGLTTGYPDIGAVQHQDAGGGVALLSGF